MNKVKTDPPKANKIKIKQGGRTSEFNITVNGINVTEEKIRISFSCDVLY